MDAKTPELKKMMGIRKRDSDGFTYVYGSIKDGSTNRSASAATKAAIRAHKRGVRAKEIARQLREA